MTLSAIQEINVRVGGVPALFVKKRQKDKIKWKKLLIISTK
jgi:hypothetical protein